MYSTSARMKILNKYKILPAREKKSSVVKIDINGRIIEEQPYEQKDSKNPSELFTELEKRKNGMTEREKELLEELITLFSKREGENLLKWVPYFLNPSYTCKDNMTILKDEEDLEIVCTLPGIREIDILAPLKIYPFGKEQVKYILNNIKCIDEDNISYNVSFDETDLTLRIEDSETVKTLPKTFFITCKIIIK